MKPISSTEVQQQQHHSVLFFEGTSFHVRPGHWKFEERINMVLSELHLEESPSDDGSGGALTLTGRIPDHVFPTMPPSSGIEFRNLTCPVPFERCLALTVPPSKNNKDGSVFHYSPVSLLLFTTTQTDGGTRVVHHNLETISWKGVKGNYSFSPQEDFLLTIFDERYNNNNQNQNNNLPRKQEEFQQKKKTFRSSFERRTSVVVESGGQRNTRRSSIASDVLDAATLAHLRTLSKQMSKESEKKQNKNKRRRGNNSIPFPPDGIRHSHSGRTQHIGRTVRTSPLLSGDALVYTATTTVHRDKSMTVDLRLRDEEQKQLPVFVVRLKLRPCEKAAVVFDSRYVSKRTARRVVLLFVLYFPIAVWRLAQFLWKHEVRFRRRPVGKLMVVLLWILFAASVLSAAAGARC